MMKVPKIYLETTIFNFPFVDDAPQYKADTLKLFDEIRAGKFEPYTSEYVLEELNNEKNSEKREKMLALIDEYNVTILAEDEEADRLAEQYVSAGIIPARYTTDGQHIAIASIKELQIIVSLNFRHIVKRKTINTVNLINMINGYSHIEIFPPAGVIEYDE
jgi:predicted nucleic acid-binding protein